MTPERLQPVADELPGGDLVVQGRLLAASNETYVADISGVRVVYKPVAGERPLWDFPHGTLAQREVAAHLVSRVLGWDIVPTTWLRDGPRGPGMVQLWCEHDDAADAVDVVPAGMVPAGMRRILDGVDAHDRRVSLVHEDTPALRRMALFDVVVNNADRKGGHVLVVDADRRVGVDHGLTFHVEPKLRTVLWGWSDEPLSDGEIEGLRGLRDALHGPNASVLGDLLHEHEVAALWQRLDRLLAEGVFPRPPETGYPVIPWPPF